MSVYIEDGAKAIAYVVTSAYAMITAEVPVHNDTEESVQFSLYNAIMNPNGVCETTTETLYSLGAGEHCVITDELLRVHDPIEGCRGYRVTSSLCVMGKVLDQKKFPINLG